MDRIRDLHYGAILADPPWRYVTWSDRGRGKCPDGAGHYDVMDLDEIVALPVDRKAKPDAVLFLWVIDSMLPQGLEVMRAWGFTFKTVAFTWVKRTRHGRWAFGNGRWTRGNPEQCLLGTRGRPRRQDAGVRQLIEAPLREHSRKPDETYDGVERLVAGPYLELFARHRRPGWDAWGNQLPPRERIRP